MNENESKPLRVQKFGMTIPISEEMLHGGLREYRWKIRLLRDHRLDYVRWRWELKRTIAKVWPDHVDPMYTQVSDDVAFTRWGAMWAAKRAKRKAMKQIGLEWEEVGL